MVKCCAFRHCRNVSTSSTNVSFHRFPLSKPQLLSKWIQAVSRENWSPSKNDFICSDHFLTNEIEIKNGKRSLSSNAIPTEKLHEVEEIKTKTPEKAVDTLHLNFDPKSFRKCYGKTDNIGIGDQNPRSAESIDSRDSGDSWCHEHGMTDLPTSSIVTVREISQELYDPLSEVYSVCENSPLAEFVVGSDVKQNSISVSVQNDDLTSESSLDQSASSTSAEMEDILLDHNYHRGDQERYIRKLKRTVEDLEEKNLILVKKIRNASEKLTRRENKITNLKDMFKEMEDQNLLLKEHLVTINEKFSSTSKALFKELGELGSNNQKKKPYSEEIRQFALTLHFYSPKAYAFLRKHFCLPHENTIREWSARVDGEPGFTGQSFEFLRQEAEKKKYQILAALDIDEMSIRKHVAWSKDKFTGFVNYGKVSNNTEEEQTVASSVLVFMLVAVNGSWKIPLGYFFVHGTPGWLLTNLVKECFSRIHETGVKCIALVCDGLSSNLTMAKMLGANLDPDAIDPSFPNPGNQSDPDDKIFLILDVCHMIKLLRNLWSDFIRIKNGLTDEEIDWQLVKSLHNLQNKEGLTLGNKLTKFHVYWKTQKMKVKLAVQVLSNSVAKSLMFMEETGAPTFKDSHSTVKFIESIDRCFDILNSRSPYAKGYKAPIRKEKFEFTQMSLEKTKELVLNLKDIEGNLLVKGKRKTGPLGLAISITSILEISKKYLMSSNPQLDYLLTYKFSQDHLELFFNTARGKGGWNNNPTTMQFEGAYKRSLATRLTPTLTGNVQPLDETEIPRLCNVRRYPDYDSPDIKPITTQEQEDEINEWFIQQENSSIFRENAVFYIAGFVVSSLCKIIKCEICLQALEEKPQEHDYAFNKHSRFTQLKDNGGLHKPSKSVHELCRLTESCIRQNVTVSMQCNKISLAIELAVLRNIVGMDIFPDLHEHMFDAELGIEHHRISLIKKIINLYRKVRLHKLAKDKNLELKGQAVRHKLSKLILFQGQ